MASHSIPEGYYRLTNDRILIVYSFMGSATLISDCHLIQTGADSVVLLRESLTGDAPSFPGSGFLEDGRAFLEVTYPHEFNKLYLGRKASDRELPFLGVKTNVVTRKPAPANMDPFTKQP